MYAWESFTPTPAEPPIAIVAAAVGYYWIFVRPLPQTSGEIRTLVGRPVEVVRDRLAAPHIRDGDLIDLLPDWCPEIPGMFLYYPGHRQVPAALRAFIDTLKELLP